MYAAKSIRGVLAGIAALALFAAAGCTKDPTDTPSTGPSGPVAVTYLTGFNASAHDAFIFVAEEKGFFDAAGLDVTIQLGTGTANLAPMLADEAQFTYIDLVGLLYNIGNGTVNSGDFRVLSTVHQSTLAALMAPEDSDITSPEDLTGKKIGAFIGSPTQFLLPVYAELAGWEYDENNVVAVQATELFGLLPAHRADAISTFIIQRGVIENAAGKKMRVWPMNEVLDDLLGTGLISTSKYATEHPDVVTKFRDAALEGLRYTLANPDEAVQILSDKNPGAVQPQAVPGFVAQINVMKPYITASGEDKIGVLDEDQVVRCISVLESAGLIPAGVTPDAIMGDGTLTASG